ncbi:MAG: asparagine synthase (glutamine-hydrolyzing) [Oscillospiraceae bacterium]|nr:asparagine synthase (glutamine-hydrolyzing) [Oscillospiraceae bacterium]
MGGFVGFLDNNNLSQDEKNNIIKQMNDKIIHRGTGGESFFMDDNIAIGLRYGMPVPPSPILNKNKNLVIFFDGRIYNSKEIKAELTEKGHVFEFPEASDSEIVLRGYEEYGDEIASKLRGAFSFVIYNTETHDLFGARDHFGVKPFYYYVDDNPRRLRTAPPSEKGAENNKNIFIFGSEIKSFLLHPGFKKEINKNALKMYLIFQYPVLEETFFKNVFKLQQGCYFNYNFKEHDLKITRYFNIEYNTENKAYEEYIDIIDKTLKSSIEYHTRDKSDVEIGGFLSGGVDSSFIASIAKPAKTFSVGFAVDGFDESVYAKELSDILKLENYKKIISSDEFFDVLPTVQYYCDEPYANLSGVPLYFLSKMAAEHVKVCLTGEGSDEFFSGYTEFAESRLSGFYSKLPFWFRKFMRKITKSLPDFKGKNLLNKYGQKVEDYYTGQAFIMDDSEANNILNDNYKNNMSYKDVTKIYFDKVRDKSDLIKKSYLDLFLWLPNDILLKADKLTAANSLEVRAPILDKEVFAVASKIPKKYLIKNKITKYIFREIANKIMPPEWANRKKVGFTVPFRFWLKEEKYYNILKNTFNEDFVSEFFIKDKLFVMLDEHFNGKKNNGRKLYTVYAFLIWYKVYFEDNFRI